MCEQSQKVFVETAAWKGMASKDNSSKAVQPETCETKYYADAKYATKRLKHKQESKQAHN